MQSMRGPQVQIFSLKRLAVSIGRNKVSSHLAIPSCGGRGVPGSAFYVAWLAEELIHRNKIPAQFAVPETVHSASI